MLALDNIEFDEDEEFDLEADLEVREEGFDESAPVQRVPHCQLPLRHVQVPVQSIRTR